MKTRLFTVAIATVTAIGSTLAALAPALGPAALPAIAAVAVPAASGCRARGPCGSKAIDAPLTRELLDRSLAIGTQFMLANQKPEGNFNYEYDWKTKKLSADDNQVRQVGALWGVALIYHALREDGRPEAELAPIGAAFDRALAYFDGTAVTTAAGERYVRYPGERKGAAGAIALMALGLIDYLRATPPITVERRAELEQLLDGYLAQLVRMRTAEGFWASDYDVADGAPSGKNNPYADGEALLAFIKAAKYLGREAMRPLAMASAEAGWQSHVVAARKRDKDSATTKGYYQWSTMSFFELATSGWPGVEQWTPRVLELADWMVDTHRTLDRGRNTGYAYEGLVHAWQLAHASNDEAHAAKLAKVLEVGLVKLLSWQVGNPIANDCIGRAPDDPLALGGVQNHRQESPLRIDVTQHMMHAVILARRYFRK